MPVLGPAPGAAVDIKKAFDDVSNTLSSSSFHHHTIDSHSVDSAQRLLQKMQAMHQTQTELAQKTLQRCLLAWAVWSRLELRLERTREQADDSAHLAAWHRVRSNISRTRSQLRGASCTAWLATAAFRGWAGLSGRQVALQVRGDNRAHPRWSHPRWSHPRAHLACAHHLAMVCSPP